MEVPDKRRKKKDKAKEKYEKNGGFTAKHVRISLKIAQQSSTKVTPK